MSFLTFNINKNHIFFPLLFISYFLRDLMKELAKRLSKDKNIIFDKSRMAKRALIDIYILSPSNLFIIFPFIIEKIRAKKHNVSNEIESKPNNFKLIYEERKFIEVPKVLKLIVLTSTFNFIPRMLSFFLFYIVNDDSKFGLFRVLLVFFIY